MSNFVYTAAKQGFTDGTHVWKAVGGDVYSVMLMAQTYAPSPAHVFVSEVAAHECAGAGYVGGFGGAGRKALTDYLNVLDQATAQVYLKAGNPTWTALNVGLIKGVAIIKEVTSDTDSPLIAWIDQGFPVITNGGDWPLVWSASGVLASV